MWFREAGKQRLYLLIRFGGQQLLDWLRLAVAGLVDYCWPRAGRGRSYGMPGFPLGLSRALVQQDCPEPGAKAEARIVSRQPAMGTKERFLHGLFGEFPPP